ncbi:hypothetical protein B566_EDAN008386 [Ephemera danica]|nr:hypothetical protein B566_EDAN008386 [Ephemera danica]
MKVPGGFDPSHTRTLPSRLGSQQQQRVMSVESMASSGSTNSLPNPQLQGLTRESIGSSPHLPTVHEPSSTAPTEKAPRRMLRLFSPGLSRKFGGGGSKISDSPEALRPGPTSPPTLLGSPKLHRALFRGRRQASHATKTAVLQPHRIPSTLPEDSPAPVVCSDTVVPDYPGLEYPPVFEPGTYTLNPGSREQFRCSPNPLPARTNRTLMLLPKPKDACWPTQSMNLAPRPTTEMSQQRRIRLTPPEAPRRLPPQPEEGPEPQETHRIRSQADQEVVLISSLDLLSSTDV